MAQNDVYRLSVICSYAGQIVNVLHFRQVSATAGDQSAALASDFRTNMDTTLRARASNGMGFLQVEVRPLIPFGNIAQVSAWAGGTVGTWAASGQVASLLAEVVTLFTASAGRRNRGRLYLSGLQLSSIAGGLVASAQTTKTQDWVNAMMTRYVTNKATTGFEWGVWSRKNAGDLPPFSATGFKPITACRVNTTLRVQRRREWLVGA